uniref:hypothetical protein n=1 Tax=Ornithobacterium rhinotracheale TaxID=28251 RepID=UPI0039A5F25F
MSRTRIVKGNITKIIGGNYKRYSKDDIVNIGSKVIQVGKEGGVTYGDNPDSFETISSNHIIDGYWSSDIEGNNEITNAKIGDKVYFHIKTQNIPVDYLPDDLKNKLRFSLYRYRKLKHPIHLEVFSFISGIQLPKNESRQIEYITWDDFNENKQLDDEEKNTIKPYDSVIVNNNKAVIPLTLSEGLSRYFVDNNKLQLYFKLSYSKDINVKIPYKEEDFLKVEKLRGDIIFQKASEIHPFPMTFDANSGDVYYIQIGKFIQDSYSNYQSLKGIALPESLSIFEKKSYNFALRRLKAGELVFNDGTTGKTSRFYERTVENIDKTFSKKIVMGINKGNFKPGVTSKGINQLEAFSNKGIAGSIKFIGKTMTLFSVAMDLSDMIIAVGNGEKPPIPFMPPFVTWEVERICNDIAEFEYNVFFNGLNNVLFGNIDHYEKGIFAVKSFIKRWNTLNPHKKYNWKVVNLSQQTLEKLINGEIKKIEHIEDLEYMDNENVPNCGILVFTSYEEVDIKHYIYAVFLPEILK